MLATTPPAPVTFAPLHAAGTIKAYAGWTAWQDVANGSYVVRVRSPGGRVTTRAEREKVDDPIDPQPNGLPFDLGPDTHGRPSIVVGACANHACHLRIGRLPAARSRQIGGTKQRFMPNTVTFWRGRLAWADARGALRLRVAPGAAPRVAHPFPGRDVHVDEAELRGDLLAGTYDFADMRAPDGLSRAIALANVSTGHRETLATVMPGDGGQQFTGPSFVGGHTVGWLLTCWDPGSCGRSFGAYRRDLRTRRTVFAHERRPHVGYAALSDTTVLLGPSQDACLEEDLPLGGCRIQKRTLTFVG